MAKGSRCRHDGTAARPLLHVGRAKVPIILEPRSTGALGRGRAPKELHGQRWLRSCETVCCSAPCWWVACCMPHGMAVVMHATMADRHTTNAAVTATAVVARTHRDTRFLTVLYAERAVRASIEAHTDGS
jgi:hypothetical protein